MKPAARQCMKHVVMVIAGAIAACSAMERTAPPDVLRAFRALDRDGDGKLDAEEFRLIPR